MNHESQTWDQALGRNKKKKRKIKYPDLENYSDTSGTRGSEMEGRSPYMSVCTSAEILLSLPEAIDSALRHGRLRDCLVKLPQDQNKWFKRGRALGAALPRRRENNTSSHSDSKESDSARLLKGITSVI